MKEYEMLRAEMMQNNAEINNTTNVLYAAVAAILAFALKGTGADSDWEKNWSFVYCLIPYVAIIPLFLLCESKLYIICWIGAYLAVFLEGDKPHLNIEMINWENRHHMFDKNANKVILNDKMRERNIKSKFPRFSHFCISAVFCSSLALLRLWSGSDLELLWKIVVTIVIFALTIYFLIYVDNHSVDFPITREELIKKWRETKDNIEHNHSSPTWHWYYDSTLKKYITYRQ